LSTPAERLVASTSVPVRPHAAPRILIVDGNIEAADSLASLLRTSGYGEARVAYDGDVALALAVEFIPSVALIDIDSSDWSGYDIARQLSQNPLMQHLRLIALTHSDERSGRERAREAGFERYLVRPVASAALDRLLAEQPR
jgi:CheY-like chemotaxis protein